MVAVTLCSDFGALEDLQFTHMKNKLSSKALLIPYTAHHLLRPV